ncbi:hypothetical protein RX410_003785 [Escherichia coli]|nr:hypothetical protein [Escherichia coli]
MKKTLIALAVAASAAVSGSAMAADWVQNGTGGSVDMGGTLTPADVITPWEVKTGDAVTNLDGHIKKGQRTVNITVNKAIPVLGIRTQTNQPFTGREGISPQVNFNSAIDPSQFQEGKTTLTLDVKDNSSKKIGSLTTKVTAGALFSWKNDDTGRGNYFSLASINQPGEVFYGGLSTNYDGALDVDQVKNIAPVIFPGSMDNFTEQGTESIGKYFSRIDDSKYSAFYASGIEQGSKINITLDQPAGTDAIAWKASLPVTVSYQ